MNPTDNTLLLENPYYHRGPIKKREHFFGRETETRDALQMLGKGECVSVTGPRRIGKTSFLFHLCDPDVKRKFGLGPDHLFIYVDAQEISGSLNEPVFYRWMWGKLLEASENALQKRMDENYLTHLPKEVNSFETMQSGIQSIAQEGFHIAFLFDEFEIIATNQNLDRDFFARLRSLEQQDNVAYATASQMPLDEITYHDESVLHSRFFNNFAPLPLGFFKLAKVKEAIHKPAHQAGVDNFFTLADFDFLYEVAGFHPFFLQVACYYLFNHKTEKEDWSDSDYELVRRQYAKDAERYFRYIWQTLDYDLRQAAIQISENKTSNLSNRVYRRLETHCLIYQGRLFSSVLNQFIKEQEL